MGYLFPLLFANFVCVSTQVIKGDHICANDDSRELNYLSEVVRQQAVQIKELYERVYAQDDDGTKNIPGQFGRHFILAFPEVFTNVTAIQLLVVSRADGRVTIKSDEPGVDRSYEISSKSGLTLILPTTLSQPGSYVGQKTVFLSSNTDIAVFVVVLDSSRNGDGYMAIPTKSLKTHYYFSMNNNAMLSIVSLYNETLIRFSPHAGTAIDLSAMGLSSYTADIILDHGQVLQIKHVSWVLGQVLGSKPFLFLQGSYNEVGYSLYPFSYIDSVFYNDGNFFIVPYLFNATDSVTICNNPENKYAISDRPISQGANYIFISGQSKVSNIRTYFQTSCHYIGHGFSVTLPSVSSYTSYCRFLTPYRVNNFTHHSAVLMKTYYINDFKFINIDSENEINWNRQEEISVNGVSYSALYYTIEQGQYVVYGTHHDVTFGVISYGFGKEVNGAYGFPVCFKMI